MLPSPAAPTVALDREYVALCLAEQIVRIQLIADHHRQADPGVLDLGPALLAVLVRLATSLGLREEVLALVVEAQGARREYDGATGI
jgi:hypothetical protein